MKRMMNARPALLLAEALATALLLCACGKAEKAVDRIGVYDSRSVAVAWAGTEWYNSNGHGYKEYEKWPTQFAQSAVRRTWLA